MTKKRWIFLAGTALVFGLLCLAADSLPAGGDPDLPHFYQMESWLARGGQPTVAGLEKLRGRGFRTVINFRNESGQVEREGRDVRALGMNYVSLPWSILRRPAPGLRESFFSVLEDPDKRPIFFHCKHGRDRTGVMSVLVLMRYRGFGEARAREEAFAQVPPHRRFLYFIRKRLREFLGEKDPVRTTGEDAGLAKESRAS